MQDQNDSETIESNTAKTVQVNGEGEAGARILFITATRIGDAVLSTGLIDHLIKAYPDCRMTIACGPVTAPLFEGAPNCERLLVLRKRKRHMHWLSLFAQIWRTKWDIIVDLRNSIISRLLLSPTKYHKQVHLKHPKRHKVVENAAVLGLEHDPPAPRLWFTRKQEEEAKQLVPVGGPILAIAPTANWIGKTWPSERFISLIASLTNEQTGILPGARVAVVAAVGEEAQANKVLLCVPEDRRINIIGNTDPGAAAAAIARTTLFIGNDSGMMHCAAAAGVPTVGLFGPSYPEIYGPWGDYTTYIQTPETFDQLVDFEGYDPAKLDQSLMTSLNVDLVEKKVRKFWAGLPEKVFKKTPS